MNNDQPIEVKYRQGFNEGYLITEHLPDLSKQIATAQTIVPRMEGFRDGRRQFVMEQLKEKQPGVLKDNQNNPDRENKSKEDIEPDR